MLTTSTSQIICQRLGTQRYVERLGEFKVYCHDQGEMDVSVLNLADALPQGIYEAQRPARSHIRSPFTEALLFRIYKQVVPRSHPPSWTVSTDRG